MKKYTITALGIILGALGGYLYYHYVGCMSGTCSITSKPLNSALYGALMEAYCLIYFKNKNMKGTIVDVRSAEEFAGEHAAGTINIPLHEIADRLEELRKLEAPLLLCCASGGRSSIAAQFLSGHGIQCKNAGSWRDNVNQTEI